MHLMRLLLFVLIIGALPLAANVHAFPGSDGQRLVSATNMVQAAPVNPYGGVSGAAPENPQGMSGVVQDIVMAGYGKSTIGEAFGRYRFFKKKEWSETRGKGGIVYVDFTGLASLGWFDFTAKKQGIASRGIEVKFVIYPGGDYGVGMVSKVEVKDDGKIYRYPLNDIGKVLNAIYANEKIKL